MLGKWNRLIWVLYDEQNPFINVLATQVIWDRGGKIGINYAFLCSHLKNFSAFLHIASHVTDTIINHALIKADFNERNMTQMDT